MYQTHQLLRNKNSTGAQEAVRKILWYLMVQTANNLNVVLSVLMLEVRSNLSYISCEIRVKITRVAAQHFPLDK